MTSSCCSICRYSSPSFIGKVYQPVLKQSSYKSELLESCNNIKLRASRVKNEANICMQRRMVDMNQALHLQTDVLVDSNEKAAQTLAFVENLYYKLLLSSESRFLPILGQQGKFFSRSISTPGSR